jgi:transposase
MRRAEVLLLAHERLDEASIATRTRCHVRTVRRIVGRYQEGGIERALVDAPRPGQPKKTSRKDDAYLIALACTTAPNGAPYWTLELLQQRFKKDRGKRLGTTTVWLRLRDHDFKPWREKNVVRAKT